MKRNQIFLRSKLSAKELFLLKKDLVDNSVHLAFKIKNLNLDKLVIEEVIKNSVEQVISTYKFGSDGSLGDLVKIAVITDLKSYYEQTYPDQANKAIWPDLDKRAPFDKLLEVLEKIKLQPRTKLEEIFWKVKEGINLRQQNILSAIYNDANVTYAEISKKFGKRGVMTYREIKIIYTRLVQVLKDLSIEL